jgi:D-glycero-D-manno-heptose 1,7-bisphosphate phosphatase
VTKPLRPAVFLDRDGVLIEDIDQLVRSEDLRVLPDVPAALERLHWAGFLLLVVTNQPIVARGLITENRLRTIHEDLDRMLQNAGAPPIDGFFFCPHHPRANLAAYRLDCPCRKPRPGLLLDAAREHDVTLAASFMVGDRLSDIAAGARAGCRTILVETGRHLDPPIQTSDPWDPHPPPRPHLLRPARRGRMDPVPLALP